MGYAGEVEYMNNGNAMLGFLAEKEKWANNGFMSEGSDGQMRAWWQNDDFKLGYDGAIPASEVHKHLLNWEPQEADIAVKLYVTDPIDAQGSDDGGMFRWVSDPDRKAIVRPDRDIVFGYFGRDSYKTHNYMPLLEQCQNIADGELGIASAFTMDDGGVFIVNMELPEDMTTEAGIDHRVRLMASTSMNGKYATRFDIVDEFCVCSNSFRINLNNTNNTFKAKHTSKSLGRIADARSALGLVYKASEEYTRFLDGLTRVKIDQKDMNKIVNGLFPIPVPVWDSGRITNARSLTIADNKQQKLLTMYTSDPKCRDWHGTLFGAFQTFSTWNQWERPTGNGLETSIMSTLDGTFSKADAEFFALVQGLEIDMSAMATV